MNYLPQVDDNKGIYYFRVIIADKRIEIECHHKRIFEMCKNYLAHFDNPDFIIHIPSYYNCITNESKNKNADYTIHNNMISVTDSSRDIDESYWIHKSIAEKMLEYQTILVHGAAVAVDDNCFIFMAPSGTGKTTHIINWMQMIPNTIVVNGDKPFVNVKTKMVYGTPWCGKENLNKNIGVPLKGLVLLERGIENIIDRISFHDILPSLLRQSYIPRDVNNGYKAYQLIGELKDIPCYRLRCNMEAESAIVAYNALVI